VIYYIVMIYTTIQKFGIGKIFKMFLKEVSYFHQGCNYLNVIL